MKDPFLPLLGFLSLGYTHIMASLLQGREFGCSMDDPRQIGEMEALVRFHHDFYEYMLSPDPAEPDHGEKPLSIPRDTAPLFASLCSSTRQSRGELTLRVEDALLTIGLAAFAAEITGAVMDLLGFTSLGLDAINRAYLPWPVAPERKLVMEGIRSGDTYRCLLHPQSPGPAECRELSFPLLR